ncbi:MAG: hypothetical protein FWB79_01510 [Treponema sp.]|nr:hypothetical protein [Treponema sp.]
MVDGELSGECGPKLDDMSRISLPRHWRDVVEKSKLVLVRDGRPRLPCLRLYTIEEWGKEKDRAVRNSRLSALERLNAKVPVEMDKQGRILIPPTLRKYAKLSKDCILVGQDDHIVVWAEDRYDEYLEADGENVVEEFKELKMLKLKETDLGDDGNSAHSGDAGAGSGVSRSEGGDGAHG